MLPLYFTVIVVVVLFLVSSTKAEKTVKQCIDYISDYKMAVYNLKEDIPNPDDLRIIIKTAIIITNECNDLLTEDEIYNMQNYVIDSYSLLYHKPNPQEKRDEKVLTKAIKKQNKKERNDI